VPRVGPVAYRGGMAGVDGDGWIRCDLGHWHWGRFGAAGLLGYAHDEAGRTHVLLQRRSWWSSHGGTWGLFGGARQRGETATAAALREAAEESTLPGDMLRIRGTVRDDHGQWAYETLVGELPQPLHVAPLSRETAAAAWVPSGAVGQLELHPGLAVLWPMLYDALAPLVIIVDAANVMGARADGWWRDRAGAAARLRDELAVLATRGVRSLPAAMDAPPLDVWFPEIILVVEGAARSVAGQAPAGTVAHGRNDAIDARAGGAVRAHGAGVGDAARGGPDDDAARGRTDDDAARGRTDDAGVVHAGGPDSGGPARSAPITGSLRVVAASGSGDDTIAELAADTRGTRLVVTADRQLRRRSEAAGAAVAGPRWLLNQL